MRITVNGAETHVATGGKPFDPSLPTVLFLHGAGLDHRCWALQTRWFAFHGYSVLAPDLPGHSLSCGEALQSIEDSGPWLDQLLQAAGAQSAHVIGHSQGFLHAMELARQYPALVASLIGIGTAAGINVNDTLLEAAQTAPAQAAEFMLKWGFGSAIQNGCSPTPGLQPIGVGQRIIAANPLAVDLKACANYASGEATALAIRDAMAGRCKMILARLDKMTALKDGLALASALDADVSVLDGYGHMLPMEAPGEVLGLCRGFLAGLT